MRSSETHINQNQISLGPIFGTRLNTRLVWDRIGLMQISSLTKLELFASNQDGFRLCGTRVNTSKLELRVSVTIFK